MMTKKVFLPLLLTGALLTGCTDIRNRRSPDLLAVDAGSRTKFAAHISQDGELISASADSPLLMPDALQTASGAEISTGHLSLLAVSGNPCSFLQDYLERQWLAPTCQVLFLPRSACAALSGGSLPAPEQISAAVRSGQVPCRTADAVLGDLLGGSGITALHCPDAGTLTLALADENGVCGMLSADACRGLALLGKRWDSFSFAQTAGICTVTHIRAGISAEQSETGLIFTLRADLTCRTAAPAEAEAILRQMLDAALCETVQDAGADLLFLREAAVRSGIPGAGTAAPEAWRRQLRNAVCCTDLHMEVAVSR